MSLQVGRTSTAGSRKELKKQLVGVACGLGVTVATLAGIGAWQASAHQSTSKPEHPSTLAVRQVVTPASAQFTRGGTIYYLAGSQEQADWLRAGLAIRDWDVDGNLLVRVVDTPEEEAFFHRAVYADYDAPVQVYDLRTLGQR